MFRILVVGTVRDVSSNFQRDIYRIQKAFSDFNPISFSLLNLTRVITPLNYSRSFHLS